MKVHMISQPLSLVVPSLTWEQWTSIPLFSPGRIKMV